MAAPPPAWSRPQLVRGCHEGCHVHKGGVRKASTLKIVAAILLSRYTSALQRLHLLVVFDAGRNDDARTVAQRHV
eukprot:2459640-Prymnesium_polylepis.5